MVTANVAHGKKRVQARSARDCWRRRRKQQDDGVEGRAGRRRTLESKRPKQSEPPMKKLTMRTGRGCRHSDIAEGERQNPNKFLGFCSRILMTAFRLGARHYFCANTRYPRYPQAGFDIRAGPMRVTLSGNTGKDCIRHHRSGRRRYPGYRTPPHNAEIDRIDWRNYEQSRARKSAVFLREGISGRSRPHLEAPRNSRTRSGRQSATLNIILTETQR